MALALGLWPWPWRFCLGQNIKANAKVLWDYKIHLVMLECRNDLTVGNWIVLLISAYFCISVMSDAADAIKVNNLRM